RSSAASSSRRRGLPGSPPRIIPRRSCGCGRKPSARWHGRCSWRTCAAWRRGSRTSLSLDKLLSVEIFCASVRDSETLEIIGAGPAGLAAAITAAKAGYRAVVYERSAGVGSRFHGDFQGLENWTTERDALEELASLGIEPTFRATPFREQHFFGADGRDHVF